MVALSVLEDRNEAKERSRAAQRIVLAYVVDEVLANTERLSHRR